MTGFTRLPKERAMIWNLIAGVVILGAWTTVGIGVLLYRPGRYLFDKPGRDEGHGLLLISMLDNDRMGPYDSAYVFREGGRQEGVYLQVDKRAVPLQMSQRMQDQVFASVRSWKARRDQKLKDEALDKFVATATSLPERDP